MKELFEIYDGSAEAKKAKRKSKNLSGFHPVFTASARRRIALDALKIWLLLGFVVGVVTGVATGAGAVSVLLGLLIAAVIYFGFGMMSIKKSMARSMTEASCLCRKE